MANLCVREHPEVLVPPQMLVSAGRMLTFTMEGASQMLCSNIWQRQVPD